VHIDFCESDVLDAFDAWRRAVGVRLPGSDAGASEANGKRRRRSLPEHLDRVCERIADRRAALSALSPDVDSVLEAVASEVAAFRDAPGPIRGEARERVVARLTELDRIMLDAARAQVDSGVMQSLRAEAMEQLSPFRDRLPSDAYDRAMESAVDGLLRDRERLPTIAFE
jgi:citrate synthase